MAPDLITLGNIRAEMARASLSRRALSRTLGLSYEATLGRLNGKIPLTVADLFRVADALGIDVAVLLPRRRPS